MGRLTLGCFNKDQADKDYSPFYVKGCAIGCGFTGSIVVLSLALHFRLRYINSTRDKIHGPVDEHQQIDITDLGESHPSFRYLL